MNYNRKERKFIDDVRSYYGLHGRRNLPWRRTRNPYRILVSEIMLQQTQVDRVVPKYTSFLRRFPTMRVLSKASLGEVLREWQGLGYNRRAKYLHTCAKMVVHEYKGLVPQSYAELTMFPGVGRYTAGAVMAFAYNEPVAIIETNIKTAYLSHFFSNQTDVSDMEILEIIERTLDRENPREWYAALMDYGSHLKQTHGNPNSRSRQYSKQPAFEGSDRQVRGAILRLLVKKKMSRQELHSTLAFERDRIDAQLERLNEELMVE